MLPIELLTIDILMIPNQLSFHLSSTSTPTKIPLPIKKKILRKNATIMAVLAPFFPVCKQDQ